MIVFSKVLLVAQTNIAVMAISPLGRKGAVNPITFVIIYGLHHHMLSSDLLDRI